MQAPTVDNVEWSRIRSTIETVAEQVVGRKGPQASIFLYEMYSC